jgi:hypothetical protein
MAIEIVDVPSYKMVDLSSYRNGNVGKTMSFAPPQSSPFL